MKRCPECKETYIGLDRYVYCPRCGVSLDDDQIYCDCCGKYMYKTETYCPTCGAKKRKESDGCISSLENGG